MQRAIGIYEDTLGLKVRASDVGILFSTGLSDGKGLGNLLVLGKHRPVKGILFSGGGPFRGIQAYVGIREFAYDTGRFILGDSCRAITGSTGQYGVGFKVKGLPHLCSSPS